MQNVNDRSNQPRHAAAFAHMHRPAKWRRRAAGGFTLIELMIAVAVVAILAGIAYPSYADYVLRGRLVDATNLLGSTRARMEQYYQDNRTYANVSGTMTAPCTATQTVRSFSVVCEEAPTATGYTITARGADSADGFVFTVDQAGRQRTLGLPSRWGTVPAGGLGCWITKKGGTC
ncbi:type IV pilin protein [Methylibium rhizosphaerae]|uniref:type IV pilin protein n=1 Tax=Methylibium rhizosphaerae TaxID=2570323 RepID=UPI002482561E|nr:type IV pilin protein [Methylibium rhizosphaerae]